MAYSWVTEAINRINNNYARYMARQAFNRAVERSHADMVSELGAEAMSEAPKINIDIQQERDNRKARQGDAA